MSFILPGGIGQIKAPGLSGFSTSNIAGSGTLSNNNRTITTSSAGGAFVGGSQARTSGQLYFEIQFPTIATPTYAYNSVGCGNASWTASAALSGSELGIGNDANSIGIIETPTWTVYAQNVSSYVGAAAAANDVIGVAVNFNLSGSLAMWFRINTNWVNRGTPTTTFPSTTPDATWSTASQTLTIACSIDNSRSATLNVGNAAFVNSPPAGYVAWG